MVMESGGDTAVAVGKNPTSLDKLVGNLWQQRQESASGSSAGNQSPRNAEELSDSEENVADHQHQNPSMNPTTPPPHHPHSQSPPPHHPASALTPTGSAPRPRSASPRSPSPDQDRQIKIKDHRDLIKEDSGDTHGLPPHLPDPRDVLRDPRALLAAGLPPLQTLEAFNRQTRDFLSSQSPHQLLANLRAAGAAGALPTPPGLPGLPPVHAPPPPAGLGRPDSQPGTPNSQRSSPVHHTNGSSSSGGRDNGQNNWSFEEQFKQLYEIDDNPKRKEFLDELFSLMQKRGTPINRLPIMAKQVLDLYELYNLVLARGGLVEVINKKQWQEVIKGLGLPSSITSAAFTLRTQYTKYLYPYECYKRNISNPTDLAQAIEGNKRENRRSSYGSVFPEGLGLPHLPGVVGSLPSQISPMPLTVTANPTSRNPPHLNGGSLSHPLPPTSRSPPLSLPGVPNPAGGQDPLSALEMTRLALWKMYNQGQGQGPDTSGSPGNPGGALKMPNIPVSLPNLPGLQSAAADLLQQAQQDKALNLQMASQIQASQKAAMEAAAAAMAASTHGKEGKLGRHNDANDNETSVVGDDVTITRTSSSSPQEHNEQVGSRGSGDVDVVNSRNDHVNDLIDPDEDEELNTASSLSPPLRPSSEVRGSSGTKRGHSDDDTDSGAHVNGTTNGSPVKKAAKRTMESLNAMAGANIKIASRNDRNGDASLVVSLEINGISYQGVLFAQAAEQATSKAIRSS